MKTGGVHEIVAFVFPASATTFVGGFGRVAGFTGMEFPDGALDPLAFVATTENVYATPMLSPLTLQLSDVKTEIEHVFDSGSDVTLYSVMEEDPLDSGAFHDTSANGTVDWLVLFDATAVTPVGASGSPFAPATYTLTFELDTSKKMAFSG